MECVQVSQLVCDARSIERVCGDVEGVCAICQKHTVNGHVVKLPPTFMSWTEFQEGVQSRNLCPECQHMLKERKYRSSSWLVTGSSFEFLKAQGVRRVLDEIPEAPWAMYATRTYKKHGWLNTEVNTSRETFYLTIDDTKYLVNRAELTGMVENVRQAAKFVGRWPWIQGDVRLEAETELALADHDLYSWWKANRSNALVLFLVSVMVPTKKELQELGLWEEKPKRKEKKRKKEKEKKTSNLDKWLGK